MLQNKPRYGRQNQLEPTLHSQNKGGLQGQAKAATVMAAAAAATAKAAVMGVMVVAKVVMAVVVMAMVATVL